MRVLPAGLALAAILVPAACASDRPPPPEKAGRPWEVALLKDPSPEVRAAAADACPRPVPDAAKEWLEVILWDADPRVRLAACRLAGDCGDGALAARLIMNIEDDRDPAVLEAAYRAGCTLGQRDACSRALVTRLVPDPEGPTALRLLAGAYVRDIEGRLRNRNPVLSAGAWSALQARWTAFLDEHLESLGEERRFEPWDPAVPPGLYGALLDH